MSEPLPSIAIADDHQLVRTGLSFVISSSNKYTVSSEASSVEEALGLFSHNPPDVLILDIGMKIPENSAVIEDCFVPEFQQNGFPVSRETILSHYGGLVILATVKKTHPDSKVLILTQHEDSDLLSKVMSLGADGIQLKAEMNDTIVSALDQVVGGKTAYSEQVSALLQQKNNEKGSHSLSPREIEILELIANGFRDKEIAERLDISPRTVAFHKANLKEKLNAESTAELIAYYFKK